MGIFVLSRLTVTWMMIGVAAAACLGCRKQNPLSDIGGKGSVIVYSLDGLNPIDSEAPKRLANVFHDFPVLGQKELVADDAHMIIGLLKKGVSEDGDMKKCFVPRHGIRVISDGHQIDMVICFECNIAVIYRGDQRASIYTNTVARDELNRYLQKSGVPLLPLLKSKTKKEKVSEDGKGASNR